MSLLRVRAAATSGGACRYAIIVATGFIAVTAASCASTPPAPLPLAADPDAPIPPARYNSVTAPYARAACRTAALG